MKSGWTDASWRHSRRAGGAIVSPLLYLILFSCAASAQGVPPVAGQTVRIKVERVDVGVVVTDAKGNFLEGLQRENFQILDDGTPQPITDFAPVETPGQVLLVVEAGPAVYLLQDAHLFVADSLLNGLSPDDRVAIACYHDAPTALLDFTTDKRAARAALDGIRFNLGFGDLNLSASLNTLLDWIAHLPGKKTIILISTGVDTSAQTTMQSLLARLQTGDVRILAVSMTGPLRHGKKSGRPQYEQTEETLAQADMWLKTLTEATGGRAFFPENAKAFQEIYRQIAQLVRHEYSLAFAPPSADGRIHAIDVKVDTGAKATKDKTPGYFVDHRKAYLAPKAAD